MFFEVGHGMVACDSEGTVIGTAMAFPYGDEIASIGSIIVSPNHQRLGIGRRLMEAICPTPARREIRLNSTDEGYRLYEQLGFKPVGTIVQHQGVVTAAAVATTAPGVRMRAVDARDWSTLDALDVAALGAPRRVLRVLLERGVPGTVAEDGGRVTGFALHRAFGRGHVIGPIIAESEAMAIAVISSHLDALQGSFARVDAPQDAIELRRLVESAGLVEVGRVTAMVRDAVTHTRHRDRVFGLISQAIG